jgi:hypothetical protein
MHPGRETKPEAAGRLMRRGGGVVAAAAACSRSSGCARRRRQAQAARADPDQRGSLSVDLPSAIPGADAITRRDGLRRRGRADRQRHVVLADGVVQAVGGADTAIPEGATRIDGTGKFVTPGIIDIHSHLGDYPSPGVDRMSGRQRGDRPGRARSLGRAQRLAAGPGLQPGAGQWRRHHAADPARLGQPVRRPLGDAQERAGAHRPGDEVPRRALRPEDGLRRESQARLRRSRNQMPGRPGWAISPDARDLDQGAGI